MKNKTVLILIPFIGMLLFSVGCKQSGDNLKGDEISLVSSEYVPSADLKGKYLMIKELSDEFENSSLDPRKWFPYNPTWLGRRPAYFAPENVEVSDGKLHLYLRAQEPPDSLKAKGYHSFSSASVRSKYLVKYGYFEVKAKAMNSVSSNAFWFQPPPTDSLAVEIDVFELCGGCQKDNYRGIVKSYVQRYPMTVHVWQTPLRDHKPASLGEQIREILYYPVSRDVENPTTGFFHSDTSELISDPFHKELKVPFNVSESYHIYGFLWTPYILTWYVDGKPVWTLENTYWHQPLTLNFNVETKQGWFGLPRKENLPSVFSIEYVRSWKIESVPWKGEHQWMRK